MLHVYQSAVRKPKYDNRSHDLVTIPNRAEVDDPRLDTESATLTDALRTDIQDIATSWGVELGCIFAFHWVRFQRILNQYDEARQPGILSDAQVDHEKLLKEIRATAEASTNDAGSDRNRWPAWALAIQHHNDFALQAWLNRKSKCRWVCTQDTASQKWQRIYALELLLIAEDILSHDNLATEVIANKADEMVLESFRSSRSGLRQERGDARYQSDAT